MNGLISIPDFMAHLKKEGLIVVKATELAETHVLARDLKHRDLLKKKSMTLAQAADVLRISKSTMQRKAAEIKKTRKDEVFTNGRTVHIMTAAVKRLRGYE